MIDGKLGWRMDVERRDELIATQKLFELPMMGDPPPEIDPRPFQTVKNQGSLGSCEGNDISECLERLYFIAANETKVFSAAHGYYGSQRIDDIHGDNGATISGGVELLTKVGLVPDEVWPYVDNYDPRPPMSWEELAKLADPFKVKSHSVLHGYDQIFNYIATGTGVVTAGTSWGYTPDAQGIVEHYRRGRGGHATPFMGYTTRKDQQGRNYLLLLNSWSKTWGKKGWAEVAPVAVDDACTDGGAVTIGVSDLSVPSVRPFRFTENPLV